MTTNQKSTEIIEWHNVKTRLKEFYDQALDEKKISVEDYIKIIDDIDYAFKNYTRVNKGIIKYLKETTGIPKRILDKAIYIETTIVEAAKGSLQIEEKANQWNKKKKVGK